MEYPFRMLGRELTITEKDKYTEVEKLLFIFKWALDKSAKYTAFH